MVTLAVVLASCGRGGGGPEEIAQESRRPCELVRQSELEAVVGGDFAPGVGESPVTSDFPGEEACQFTGSTPGGGTALVTIGRVRGFAQKLFSRYERDPRLTTVADVGDAAVWNPKAKFLVALQDQKLVTVSLFGTAEKDPLAATRRLALLALPRA